MADARMADWLDALGQFPRWAIEDAVKAWNGGAGGNKRPTPAAMSALCHKAVQPLREAVAQGKRMEPGQEKPRNRVTADRAAAILAEVAAKRRVSE